MTDDHQTQTDDQVRAAISAHLLAVPQTRLAREAGISAPTISQWLRDKYKGNNQAVKDKLRAWIATHAQSAAVSATIAPNRTGWIETPASLEIERAFVVARSVPTMAVIYGPPGIGKTSTAKHYASTTPNVWYVAANSAVRSMAAILKLIGMAVNARGGYRNYDLSQDIINRVTGTRGLLVIDEFQHLSLPAKEQVRAIHDAAEIGIALVGNEVGWSDMGGRTRSMEHAQLFSRCWPVVPLSNPKEGDVLAILDAWNMTETAMKELAMHIAAGGGGLRNLVKTLQQAALYSPESGTPDFLAMRTAWEQIRGAS